ncbi:GATOR complex protein WDR24-like isoform X1 [Limulus polyphemus]|uniref:GATOR2 complex protein WDR24 n=2 Tax=Limulus polyphemus TaxID=6850 RepID=A0ABM1TDC4_LIMPO|nr:GATOR complex protein WDR24-like isoform X1 [Limulus polyphemus]XP_022253880.1 GATOR complex protein WDR24-like isoform X1 [Limulus polyphemus]XP_022253881.1 GATOR complex protein WDR24-like isoform X1 [Limulus polyphemus]
MVSKSIICYLDGPANALAINRDSTQVVVAGRNVFKIFNIEEEEFVERLNLRVGKNLNLNFSCADVVWNPVEDNILATAATNGAVVTWNINKTSRSKQDMVFQDHKRSVNKVCFHTIEPHILLSGSQDGTMKCFDLRKKEASSTFYSLSESVRDVKFSPHHYFLFAAVQENGNVQIWDMRRTDRYEKQFTAHTGPVFTCDWHPEERRWLATGGRDKTIKIWDLSMKPMVEHCIQTIASVARIKWRPQQKFHIASCSLVIDFTINVWDIRRPFVPLAAFNEHKDVSTGFAWHHEPHIILSTSKDSTLYLHVFKDAIRPADHANPIGLDISCYGDISYAASNKIVRNGRSSFKGESYSSTKLPVFFRKHPSASDQFRSAVSSIFVFKNDGDKFLSMTWFIESARRYILSGRSFAELCEHNASVASDLQRPHVAQTWRILKLLYNAVPNLGAEHSWGVPSVGSISEMLKGIERDEAFDNSQEGSKSSRHNSGNTFKNRHQSGSKQSSRHVSGGTGNGVATTDRPDTSGATDNSTDSEESDNDKTITNIASGLGNTQGDFFFGDGETDQLMGFQCTLSQAPTIDSAQDWNLPGEAFQPRHPIKDCSPPPELDNAPSSPTSFDEDYIETKSMVGINGEVYDYTKLLMTPEVPSSPAWVFNDVIVDMLHYFAAQGDVQMCVSVLLVLGERFKGFVDETTQEQWFHSYIEILSCFQLWNVANKVISLSTISSISSLNQQSTTIHTLCGNCRRQMTRIGWFCDRCKIMPTQCSVCHQAVRGLYAWCQGCAHGGHLQHIQEWLQYHPWCPTGCGHLCEYT